MGENNWMASEGLDFDMNILGLPESVNRVVTWGEIRGEFISYSSAENQIVLEIKHVKDLFAQINSCPKQAQIIFDEEVYTIEWIAYNYVVSTVGNRLIITVMEKNNEK